MNKSKRTSPFWPSFCIFFMCTGSVIAQTSQSLLHYSPSSLTVGYSGNRIEMSADSGRFIGNWKFPFAGGGNSLVTSNSSSVIFSGNGTVASPLSAATTNIAGITNAVLVRDAGGKPAASSYVTLSNKTVLQSVLASLTSSTDFTVSAPYNNVSIESGIPPNNCSVLYLNASAFNASLSSGNNAYTQAVSLLPNSIQIQVNDKNNTQNLSYLLLTSNDIAAITDRFQIYRRIGSDRRRTGIMITGGQTDIDGIWIQDGMENPPADNVLSGAYLRANKNLGVKLGFQGNPQEPAAYINITKDGSIRMTDMNGSIDVKYITQMATGIKATIGVNAGSSIIDINLSPVVQGNIYILNFALNGAKTLNVINAAVPANCIKEFEIWIPQGATVQPVTWFSGITWISGAPVMTANKTSVFTFRTVDGVNYTGNLAYAF